MNEREKLIAAHSGWLPKHLLEALEKPEAQPVEDKPKRGRPRKEKDVVHVET